MVGQVARLTKFFERFSQRGPANSDRCRIGIARKSSNRLNRKCSVKKFQTFTLKCSSCELKLSTIKKRSSSKLNSPIGAASSPILRTYDYTHTDSPKKPFFDYEKVAYEPNVKVKTGVEIFSGRMKSGLYKSTSPTSNDTSNILNGEDFNDRASKLCHQAIKKETIKLNPAPKARIESCELEIVDGKLDTYSQSNDILQSSPTGKVLSNEYSKNQNNFVEFEMRTKSPTNYIYDNRARMKSSLICDVPFYQDYSKNSLLLLASLNMPAKSDHYAFNKSNLEMPHIDDSDTSDIDASPVGDFKPGFTRRSIRESLRRRFKSIKDENKNNPSTNSTIPTINENTSSSFDQIDAVEPNTSSVLTTQQISENLRKSNHKKRRPTNNSDTEKLPRFKGIIDNSGGPGGVRWASTQRVVQSGLLDSLSKDEIKRQEALFEVITSEASYYRSLTSLIEDYCSSNKLNEFLMSFDKHTLFSNIGDVYEASGIFLSALEARWMENPYIYDICDIVRDFAQNDFRCYVLYLKNQFYQNAHYKKLSKKVQFCNILRQLQKVSQNPMLSIDSFLMLPLQRVCRLQLLVRAIIQRTPESNLSMINAHQNATDALSSLEQLINECDREKYLLIQRHRIAKLCNRLAFSEDFNLKTISLGDPNRSIVKMGDLGVLRGQRFSPNRLFNQSRMKFCTMILVNDHVLLAKKRKISTSNGKSTDKHDEENDEDDLFSYLVLDILPLNRLIFHAAGIDPENANSTDFKITDHSDFVCKKDSDNEESSEQSGPYLIHLLSSNNDISCKADEMEANSFEYLFDAGDLCNLDRWLDSLSSVSISPLNVNIKKFASVRRNYLAVEDDELDLKEGEIIGIQNSRSSSFWKGVNKDNRKGWFPSQNVQVVSNDNEINSHAKEFGFSF